MHKRITLHDILEIKTPKGLCYAQFSFDHPRYGQLIRVFKGLYKKPLIRFYELVEKDEQFVTFLPLQTAVNQGLIKIAGNVPTPYAKSALPIFRTGLPDPKTNRVESWSLLDGQQTRKVGTLTEEQRRYPILGIWSHPVLIERILSDWTPETDKW